MKPFFQHLRIALIAIIVASLRSQRRSRNWKFIASERRPMTARDGTSPSRARDPSRFCCRFLQRFHDERRHDGRDSMRSRQDSGGIKFSAVELAAAAKPLPTSIQFKIACATPANKVSDVRRSTRGEADILTLTMANTTTTLYMHCIQLGGARYMLSIEFPNAHASWSLPTKTSSSNPSNSRRNPDPGRSGSLTACDRTALICVAFKVH